MATPETFIEFSRQRGLAPDGRCKAYADAADGTAWGEGVGVLVVERLAQARHLGHRVLAILRGSAVNQDGASDGLTAPSEAAQQRVIMAALARAGLSPADVDVVEGHGTGTRLGDPAEARALLATYGQGRPEGQPVLLGSVKSNLGHAQAAAGMAGIIKTVSAMRHGIVPATLHVDAPSARVDWTSGAVRLVTEPEPWPRRDRPRRAGVSSFGFSGTNAHVIIEQAPGPAGPQEDTSSAGLPEQASAGAGASAAGGMVPALGAGVTAWLVSARTADSLAAQAGRLAEWTAARPELDAGDVAWSLATTRSVFEHRAVVTGADRGELLAGLAAVAAGESSAGVVAGPGPAAGGARVGFLFSGQGSQRAGMGAELHAASPVFAAAFDEACALLEAELGVPVAGVVLGGGEDERADQTLYAQAGLFAVQAGLVALLASCGVVPDAVAGHSVGEVGAAYAAGVLSLADACRLVAARARLMQALPGGGAMTAVEAAEVEVSAALDGAAGVSVAVVNGPSSVVISGDADAVEGIAESFRQRGRRVRALRVSHAFHSARMDPMLAELGESAAVLEHRAPRVLWVQAVTGEPTQECGPGYWPLQARQPVRFADTVAALAAEGVRVFVEIGPDGTLSALGPAALPADGGAAGAVFVPVLRAGQAAGASVLAALAEVHVHGGTVDWARVLGRGRRVGLPTYAFKHQRFWLAAGKGQAAGLGPSAMAELPPPVSGAGSAAGGQLRRRLAGLEVPAQHQMLRDLVRAHAAVVLGHASAEAVEPGRSFKELGFSSLTALELPQRLRVATGLPLSDTVTFDYPTPLALAGLLRAELVGPGVGQPLPDVTADRAHRGEAVAVVAMGCRLPGGASSPDELWHSWWTAGDAVSEFPRRPWLGVERLYDADPDHAGTHYTRFGGFLAEAAEFDAGFFGISPREALAMDPQQRLLLETSWEALEDAGIDPGRLRAARRGCSPGRSTTDYGRGQQGGQGEGYPADGRFGRRRLWPGVVRARPGGPGGHGGHRVLVVAGRAAPGRAVAAVGGVRPGAGRRGHRDGDPGDVRGVLPAAGPGAGRAVQGLRRRRGRHRVGRGGRGAGPGAAARRPPQRAPGPGRGAGQRGEPGRGEQRADRPERARPAAGHPRGAGRRGARPAGRGRG